MQQKLILIIGILGCAGAAQSGETMRCGQWVVDASTTVSELVNKCGEPSSKKISEEDIRARVAGGGTRKVGTTVKEEWTYDRGRQSLPMMVTIVDGKIRSIERLR